MNNEELIQLVARLTHSIAENEHAIHTLEAINQDTRDLRAMLLAGVAPAHILDDLQLVVPL
jgi:hypothetical protein